MQLWRRPGPPEIAHPLKHSRFFPKGLPLLLNLSTRFASRSSGIVFPLLILGLAIGGWIVYRNWYDPTKALERADVMWDSGDSRQRVAAVREYKFLLRKTDPIEARLFWLKGEMQRKLLYQKIIEYHVKYDASQSDAREWLIKAWSENLRDLNFGSDEELNRFWKEETERIKKNRDPYQLGK